MVSITDQLDLVNHDVATVSLGPLGFGDRLVTPAPFQKTFATTIDLRPSQDLLVAVKGDINSTGLLRWNLKALDPGTGLPPTDPAVGFLPPGGEGSVFFTVVPKEDALREVGDERSIALLEKRTALQGPWAGVKQKAIVAISSPPQNITTPGRKTHRHFSGFQRLPPVQLRFGLGISEYRSVSGMALYEGEAVKLAHILEGKELAALNRGEIVTFVTDKGEEIHLAAKEDPLYQRRVRQAARARRAKGRRKK